MNNPTSLTFKVLSLEDIQRLAVSEAEFLSSVGCSAAPESLLPPEVVPTYLASLDGRNDWIGILAIEPSGNQICGSGAFKSVPIEGIVEIGYGVSPAHRSQGVGTAICAALVGYAREHGAQTVRAQTLAESAASQKILARNNFKFVGDVVDPDDGPVQRYELSLDAPD